MWKLWNRSTHVPSICGTLRVPNCHILAERSAWLSILSGTNPVCLPAAVGNIIE